MDENKTENTDELIARLVRLAGARPAVPDARTARVRAGVHDFWRESLRRTRRRRLVRFLIPMAAVLAAGVAAGALLRWRTGTVGEPAGSVRRAEGRVMGEDGRPVAAGVAVASGSGLSTGPDGRAALLLRSGPAVRVDTDTDLRLISSRVLELRRGAIYIDTRESAVPDERDQAGGLEVRTRLGRVLDVGTQFEVRLSDDALRVSVREGSVRVDRDDRTYPALSGTRLRVDDRGAVQTEAVPVQGAGWSWIQSIAPPFVLEGRSLEDYIAWLSRETGWRVSYADASIAAGASKVILHGSTSGLRPDETPGAVLPACGLRHRVDAGTLVVERASSGDGR